MGYDMEIGEYLTNVLAINDLASLHYKYLECPSEDSTSLRTTISSIVTTWRQVGCLVAQDASKPGIWLFGSDDGTEPLTPSSVKADSSGLIETQDITLTVKQDDVYTYESIKSLARTLMAPAAQLNAATNSSSPVPIPETNGNTNTKAVISNAVLAFNREPGPSGMKKELFPLGPGSEITDHFFSAIIGGMNYQLCHGSGYIALNSRTLLMPSSDGIEKDENDKALNENINLCKKSQLITLGLDITSLGTLIVKASLSYSTYSSVSTLTQVTLEGTNVFLAPGGRIARYISNEVNGSFYSSTSVASIPCGEGFVSGSPGLKQAIERWKRRCLNWLVEKGVKPDILESDLWYMVQVSISATVTKSKEVDAKNSVINKDRLITVPWPAVLCFRPVNTTRKPNIQWSEDDYDPLHNAEGWYKNRMDRDAIIGKRKKERDAEAASKAQADNDARNSTANIYSPVALRRASIVGMVYPTPPDGVQHTVGATPSFDGNVSTPGQPNLHVPNIDADNTIIMKGEPGSENKLWDSSASKKEQSNSGPDFSNGGNDNLFGEIDEDLFGENDITDADFSFFDEPDVVQDSREANDSDEMIPDDFVEEPNQSMSHSMSQNDAPGNDGQELGVEKPENQLPTVQHGYDMEDASPTDVHVLHESPTDQGMTTNDPADENLSIEPVLPLSPALVFKRLQAAETRTTRTQSKVSDSIIPTDTFHGVNFDSSISFFDEKYGTLGRFIYPSSQKVLLHARPLEIPRTEYLNRKRKRQRQLSNPDHLPQALILPPGTAGSEPIQSGFPIVEVTVKDSSAESQSSEPDDDSTPADNSPLILGSGMKRKRGLEIPATYYQDHDDVASSFQSLNMELESPLPGVDALDLLEPNLFDWDPADWSLAKFLTFPELPIVSNSLVDDEYIAAAQVLADQAIARSFQVPGLSICETVNTKAGCEGNECGNNDFMQQHIVNAAREYFKDVVQCDLNAYLELRGTPLLHQINRTLPPRPGLTARSILGEPLKQSSTFVIPPPHLEVRRSDSKLTVLPSAIPFWENLGLGPCRGGKDVLALCMYPSLAGLHENVHAMLEHVRSAYEAGRFGTHELFPNEDLVDTLFPVETSGTASAHTPDLVLSTLKERFSYLAGELAAAEVELEGAMMEEKNIVVYFVYDSSKPELLLSICAGFNHMLETYQDALSEKKISVSNEIILQLLPMSLFDTPTSIGVPQPLEYARIAMEVYDRCIDLATLHCTPSIVLDPPLPRIIDFKQTPNPSASLLRENSCLHLAYAQSIDDRWVTAAWTDSTGMEQMTASYCLGRKGIPITRNFSDIAREIWQTTMEAIASKKVTWRIMIAKCGVMDPSEMEFWKGLASSESHALVSLTLLTVDSDPSLQLLPPSLTLPPSTLSTQTGLYTTPVSTPQAAILSPEQSGNVTTPARDGNTANAATPGDSNVELKIDPDATLVDVTDQSWGAILSHRINNSNSLLVLNPTLVSGYLLKRGGTCPSDVPVVIEVNLVYSEGNPRIYDAYLREILGFYRGLATLARARGVVDAVNDGRPWHVAAAEKAVRALYMLM